MYQLWNSWHLLVFQWTMKLNRINKKLLIFYDNNNIMQYDFIEAKNSQEYIPTRLECTIEKDYNILSVSKGWSYPNQYVFCQHSKTTKYKIFTLNLEKNAFDNGFNINKSVKTIQSGDNHQLYLCNNGECYGMGINTVGQLGFDNNIQKLEELTLLESCVKDCVCMPYASLIQTENGIYSCGMNKFSCIGHKLNTNIEWINGFQLIEFTHISTPNNIEQVKAGNTYTVFISSEKYHYFLGQTNTLLHWDHEKPDHLLYYTNIVKSYTACDDIYFIVEGPRHDLSFFTFGVNIFQTKSKYEFVSFKYICKLLGCNKNEPIIDFVFCANETLILQATSFL